MNIDIETYQAVVSVVQPMLDKFATYLPVTRRRYCVSSDADAEMQAAAALWASRRAELSEEQAHWLRHYEFYDSLAPNERGRVKHPLLVLASTQGENFSGIFRALWERYAYICQIRNIAGGNVFVESGKTMHYYDLDWLKEYKEFVADFDSWLKYTKGPRGGIGPTGRRPQPKPPKRPGA